jgi:hypothetical protein
MDNNTHDVLLAVIALVSAIVTPLVLVYVTRKQNEKIDGNAKIISSVAEKVDGYHKEVNGNMAKLLETTKDLATAQEKARAEDAKKKH